MYFIVPVWQGLRIDHPTAGVCGTGHNNTYQLQRPEAISNKFDIVQPQGTYIGDK